MAPPEAAAVERAAPPQAPQPTRALARDLAAQRVYRLERERREQRSLMRGLLMLVLLVLLVSIARAGLDRVFVPGWWRQW